MQIQFNAVLQTEIPILLLVIALVLADRYKFILHSLTKQNQFLHETPESLSRPYKCIEI